MSEGGPNVERLKLIQAIVSRLAGESANVKTWTVGLTTALVLLARLSEQPRAVWALIPLVVIFGVLDGYYLGLERAYRALYRQALTDPQWAWSLELKDLKTLPYSRGPAWAGVKGHTILAFYGALLLALVVAGLIPMPAKTR